MVEILTVHAGAALAFNSTDYRETEKPQPVPLELCEQPQEAPMIVKNLAQMVQLRAFERMLSAIYNTPMTFAMLLEKIGCELLTVQILEHLYYTPVCAELFEQLSKHMSTTDEGKRLFTVAKIRYGFYGSQSCSNSAIALKLRLTALETRQTLIRLKARLQSKIVRDLVERLLSDLVAKFMRSALYQVLRAQRRSAEQVVSVDKLSIESECEGGSIIPHLVHELGLLTEDASTVNICGGNGMGETEIAYSLAMKLSAAGKKVLLVNHSRMLAVHLRQQYATDLGNDGKFLQAGELTISTFHALCHWAAQAADLKTPKYISTRIFNEIFPELLVEASQLRPEIQFDVVIAIEGHCFGPNMWRALKHCLRDNVKGLYLYFYDPQLLNFNRLSLVPTAKKTLDLEQMLLSDRRPSVREIMELYETRNDGELCETVEFLVNDLIASGLYTAREIVILHAGNEKNSRRFRFDGGLRSSRQLAKPQGKPTVLETSLFQFRALTAKVVILIGLDPAIEKLTEWKLQYFTYLLAGRVSKKLILAGSTAAMSKLLPRATVTLSNYEIGKSIV